MSKLKSKVVTVNKRRTSVRLCHSEWQALDDVCKRENISRNAIIEAIDKQNNENVGLTGSIRLFSLVYYHSLVNDHNIPPKSYADKEYLSKILDRIKN